MRVGTGRGSWVLWTGLFGAIAFAPATARSGPGTSPRSVKVLIITSTTPEGQPWIDQLGLTENVPVAGLLSPVACNADDVCLVVTGPGKANAAASAGALAFGGAFDLSATYFLVATVAGIDPSQGTVGSVAWATNIVDYAISWEVDARMLPPGWTTGYLGVGATSPAVKPPSVFSYGTELFTLDAGLVAKAVALSKSATLADGAASVAFRAPYAGMVAAQPPAVIACDTVSSDTAWHGELLGNRARAWTALLTSGGTYCTTQAADNAVVEALQRAGGSGLLDAKRIAVVHAAASFDRPYTGQTAVASLQASSAAVLATSLQNLVLAGQPLVANIVSGWGQWQKGVPQ